MELADTYIVITLLTLLLSIVSTTAQSPPAPILPPSPAPPPAPHHVNLTDLFTVAGSFHTFLAYLEKTHVIDTFQSQANITQGGGQGITIFVPKDSAFALLKSSDLAGLSEDQLRSLLLYHAFPRYYALADFRNLSRENPVVTFAGGQYTLNVTETAGRIRVISSWSASDISSSVYATNPVAVYQVDRVMLPLAIFSADPPQAPAPEAPESSKPSDVTPSGAESPSEAASSEGSSTGGSDGTSVGVLNRLVFALSGGLVLLSL